ncbi:nitrilase-related carbon-nitrogen hydrolase [Carboxylicivirga sp. RSCT41]|uniref:nitrilase-related carbon-nitrogen hydrolase n=1 Tax=Carboxylicivirga agarovorans TaxID=3417570 RepID=UPI003D34FD7B
MKISLLQYAPQLNNLQANLDAISALMAPSDSDLYVLPELSNSGYNFIDRQNAFDNSESIEDSIYIQRLMALAKNKNAHIVSGFCERDNDKLYNSSVLINSEGVAGLYRKLHLFLNEKDYFEPGNKGLPVFDTPIGKIGMLICFDWMFPEAWRTLALKGAQIIAHPSNLVLPYCQGVTPSYALVNRCYTATANRIGTEGDLTFTGQSVLSDINGKVVIKGSKDESQLLSAEIDISLADSKYVTARNHVFEDRRNDVYGDLNIGTND